MGRERKFTVARECDRPLYAIYEILPSDILRMVEGGYRVRHAAEARARIWRRETRPITAEEQARAVHQVTAVGRMRLEMVMSQGLV